MSGSEHTPRSTAEVDLHLLDAVRPIHLELLAIATALLVYGILDVLTTTVALSLGAWETNPIAAWAWSTAGPLGLVAHKMAALLLVFALLRGGTWLTTFAVQRLSLVPDDYVRMPAFCFRLTVYLMAITSGAELVLGNIDAILTLW